MLSPRAILVSEGRRAGWIADNRSLGAVTGRHPRLPDYESCGLRMAKLRLSYPAFRMPAVVSGSGALRTLVDLPSFSEAVFMMSGQASVRAAVDESLAK